MALLFAIARIMKVEEDRYKNRETSEVLKHHDERPATQKECQPVPDPFQSREGESPARSLNAALSPCRWSLTHFTHDHAALSSMCCLEMGTDYRRWPKVQYS